jgi:DNA topoisomerase VI subunit B
VNVEPQAEPVSVPDAVFTNCGKAEQKETRANPARKLTRVPFQVSRLMEFCNRRELVNQTGHDTSEWPLVVLKELVDNALDESEEAGIPPLIEIAVDGDKITIADNGRGIPAKTIESVLDYSIRVSSREAYVSPTRGAQGNALKTILPMGYVLDGHHDEDAAGETIIEARGIAHCIRFSVDHIRQEPKIGHITSPSLIDRGTRITVELPRLLTDDYWATRRRARFLTLAESYAWINPHLTLRVVWNARRRSTYRRLTRRGRNGSRSGRRRRTGMMRAASAATWPLISRTAGASRCGNSSASSTA